MVNMELHWYQKQEEENVITLKHPTPLPSPREVLTKNCKANISRTIHQLNELSSLITITKKDTAWEVLNLKLWEMITFLQKTRDSLVDEKETIDGKLRSKLKKALQPTIK